MNIPILRKTIRLSHLAAATIAIRAVVTFDERSVDLPTATRLFQHLGHLFFRAEYNSITDVCDASVHTSFVNRRIDQILARLVSRSLRTATFAGSLGSSFDSKGFQNRLLVRLVFVARDQPRSLVFQAFRRVLHQQVRVLFRPFAVDDFQHKFMLGVQRNMIPVVTASGIIRIFFVAMLLLLVNEVPLLVELNLVGVGGKNQPTRREGLRRVLQPISCNDLLYRDRLLTNVLSFAHRHLQRRVREWRRRLPPAAANRTKPFRVVRKNVVCKSGSTTIACCSGRKHLERGYFPRHEHRVWDTFYSDNKTCEDRS